MSWKNRNLDDELFTYEYFLQPNVCRICWSLAGVKEINYVGLNGESISDKVNQCIGVILKEHPKKICEECSNEIEHFSAFRQFCRTAEIKLQEILQKSFLSSANGPEIKDLSEQPDICEIKEDISLNTECDDIFLPEFDLDDAGRIKNEIYHEDPNKRTKSCKNKKESVNAKGTTALKYESMLQSKYEVQTIHENQQKNPYLFGENKVKDFDMKLDLIKSLDIDNIMCGFNSDHSGRMKDELCLEDYKKRKKSDNVKKKAGTCNGNELEKIQELLIKNDTSPRNYSEIDKKINNFISNININNSCKPKQCNKKVEFKCKNKTSRVNLKTPAELSQLNFKDYSLQDGVYKCFGCEKRFSKKTLRVKHEGTCESLKNGYKCDNDKCCIVLSTRVRYEKHLQDHKNNDCIDSTVFECKKCMKTFETVDLLEKHAKVHDMDGGICDICGKVVSRRNNLQTHLLTHTGVKPYKCSHCNYRTCQKSSYNIHMRIHTGVRPYLCDLCPQRCVTKSNLRKHKVVRHLGGQRFECKLCSKIFGYKSSLDDHMATVHETAQRLTCEDCGATYARFKSLKLHLSTKHGKELTRQNYKETLNIDTRIV